MRASASAWFFLLAAGVPAQRSRADPTDIDADAWRSFPAIASVQPRVPAVLTMSYGGGAGALGRAPHGFFAAGDGGAAVFLPEKDLATRVAAAFGVRAGYHWRNGLALTLCFDDLGVEPSKGGGSLLIPSVSVRYSLPFVVEPFAEAMVGGVFDQAMAAPTAGLGFGLSVPVVRHLALEVGIRNWMMSMGGSMKDIPSLELGAAVGFTGH